MKKHNLETLELKIGSIIESCNTIEQLISCTSLVINYRKIYGGDNTCILLYLCFKLKEAIQLEVITENQIKKLENDLGGLVTFNLN